MKCSCCGIELEGWIYYHKGNITICHFCYKGLEVHENDKRRMKK
jgi:hypothetical protein